MNEPTSRPAAAQRAARVRPHVLVVTTDADLRDFLQEGLLLGGFWVSVIASGVQTLEVFRLRSFDLVIIDAALPGLAAVELIRRLRGTDGGDPARASRTEVPILLIAEGDEIGAAAVTAGADAVLMPPLELEAMIPMLHTTVQHWRLAHPDQPWADQAAQLRPRA